MKCYILTRQNRTGNFYPPLIHKCLHLSNLSARKSSFLLSLMLKISPFNLQNYTIFPKSTNFNSIICLFSSKSIKNGPEMGLNHGAKTIQHLQISTPYIPVATLLLKKWKVKYKKYKTERPLMNRYLIAMWSSWKEWRIPDVYESDLLQSFSFSPAPRRLRGFFFVPFFMTGKKDILAL